MEIFTASLLLVVLSTSVPNTNGAYLKPLRTDTTQSNHDNETNKTSSFDSVASFCASHPFAGGCETDDQVQRSAFLEDQRTAEYDYEESDEDLDQIPSLLTVAFFCSSHPSAVGCPKIAHLDSEDIENIITFPDIMFRFCILHPTAYGCPKISLVRNPPSLPLPLPLPPPVEPLDNGNEKKNISETLPERVSGDIQPYEYRVWTEFFNDASDTYDAESLMASTNETHEVYEEIRVDDGNQLHDELTVITGRSVGETPISETNDLVDDQGGLIEPSIQTTIPVFESVKVIKPKVTLSLPPPVDAIFASGRYAWQKSATRSTPEGELTKRLNRGKTKPLPSVKQVLGPLAL